MRREPSVLRSVVFNIVFYVVTAAYVIVGSFLLLGPRSWAMAGLRSHARTILFLLRHIVGMKMEVRGAEHLPVGAALVAAKHQSAWETFALIPLFRDPALIMKRELMWIPFHGWFSKKFGMIPIDRRTATGPLRQLLRDAKNRAAQGREILIFPEGTRRSPGAPPDYKTGIVFLYDALGLPCVPVALNSGCFWPRRSFMRRPGTVLVEVLPPLPAGLPKRTFLRDVEERIETASDRLRVEAEQKENIDSAVPPV